MMNRYHLLAAETFGYSFDNYDDHLGIGHVRYETLMPDDARTLEKAEAEGSTIDRVAKAMEVDVEQAPDNAGVPPRPRSGRCGKPRRVVPLGGPASIELAVSEGLGDEPSIERLVKQICYRAADLGLL